VTVEARANGALAAEEAPKPSILRPVRQVLKLSAYRRLLVAYTINELAWSLGPLALAVLIYRRTGSAIGAMAFFLCSQFLPALFAPSLVARLDQRPPRRVLSALYGLEGVVFVVLALLTSSFELAAVLVLTVLDGVLALTARSIARAATVAVTAPAGLLREGNALMNVSFSVCYMAGPALGGLVVLTGGTKAALFANAGLFAVVVVTLASARSLPGPVPEQQPAAGRVRAAWSYVGNVPAIRTLLSLQATALAFFTISIPVEVVFAQHSLHAGGGGGYGALLSAWGAGAIIGSAVYARWRALASGTLIAVSAALLAAGFAVMAAAPTLLVAIVGGGLAGVGNGIESVAVRTALQELVQERWMTLVMGLNESISQAAPGVGILIGGVVTALAGPRVALAVAAAGALGIALLTVIVLRPGKGLLDPPEARADAPAARPTAAQVAKR
jgi:predicted MFS family arabinose efflux permease